jgi:predicted transcriptional regulator
MAVISVRLNSEEEKILSFLSQYYEEEKSTIVKHSLKDMYEDIKDREIVEEFEKKEKGTVFLSAEEILKGSE